MFFAAPTESLGCTSLMGAPPCVRLTLVISTKRITWLHYSYECATLSKAYACLPLFSEGLGYTIKKGVQPLLQPMLLSSTYKIMGVTVHFWMRHFK